MGFKVKPGERAERVLATNVSDLRQCVPIMQG